MKRHYVRNNENKMTVTEGKTYEHLTNAFVADSTKAENGIFAFAFDASLDSDKLTVTVGLRFFDYCVLRTGDQPCASESILFIFKCEAICADCHDFDVIHLYIVPFLR